MGRQIIKNPNGNYPIRLSVTESLIGREIPKNKEIRSLHEEAVQKMHKSLIEQMEQVFIKGLSIKGYNFKNRQGVETFIKSNCTCEDYQHLKHKVYKVNGIPFLIHYYDTQIEHQYKENKSIMTASCGKYAFI